jgi:hypothetical protein
MGRLDYKKKISQRLDSMDAETLKQTWLILKEIKSDKKNVVPIDRQILETKLSKGIEQLNNGEGADFASFMGGIKKRYARK